MNIIAVLPAYNAAKTIAAFVASLPRDVLKEIIVVDDCSQDDTYDIAKHLKDIYVYQTPQNLGYGGCLKHCLSLALDHGADVIMELHPDGEYGTDGIRPAIEKIHDGADLVLGNRFAGASSGMYWWKKIGTLLLTTIDNMILQTTIPDIHQGFRIYTKELLQGLHFHTYSDEYIFSFEIIVDAIARGYRIDSVPVSTRYQGNKRGAGTAASIRYALGTFRVIGRSLCSDFFVFTTKKVKRIERGSKGSK